MTNRDTRDDPREHPFVLRPHRTLIALALPIMTSLIAEPLTGLADTAFVASLGESPLAALGVGTILLSSSFWIFNFLGVSTQTEVARALGQGEAERGSEITSMALRLAMLFGSIMAALGIATAEPLTAMMDAEGAVQDLAVTYLRIRLLGAPAVLVTLVAFGALRGVQDVRTPLWIALAVNLVNIGLDYVLIFGAGPIPAFGIAGAAWATVAAHYVGALWAIVAVRQRIGAAKRRRASDVRLLLVIGGDLFLRTLALTLYLLYAGRVATGAGDAPAAAHQAIRQFWLFTAYLLDAFGAAAQTLVGYFLGAQLLPIARRVIRISIGWGIASGTAVGIAMLVFREPFAAWFVPPGALEVFASAWIAAAVLQPINAVSFVTDGILWGTRDYRFLRNVMLLASVIGVVGLLPLDGNDPDTLLWIWIVTGAWVTVRAVLGAWKCLRGP